MRSPDLMSRTLLVGALLLTSGQVAAAGPPLAVLAFGGANGQTARATLVNALSRRYEIVDGQMILDACDEMGITMTRGRNLARAAARAGVVAIIGGAVSGGHLSLAVYSGKSGDVVSSGRVRTRGRLSKKALREALTVILKGLRKCPKRAPRRRSKPAPPPPEPTPAPSPPAPAKTPSLVFDPDPVVRTQGDTPAGTELTPYQGGSGTAASGEENPLAPPVVVPAAGQLQQDNGATVAKKPTAGAAPKVEGTIGFGTWLRSLRINQPDPTHPAPKYDSGAAFALGLGFKARPLAFFLDNFLANLYSRMAFQTMLGLESRNKTKDSTGAEVVDTYGTSLWELRWELVGYDWKILSKASSPHIEGGIGFGLMSFSIDWGDATSRPMPDASYKYFLTSIGAYMPFISMLGGHLRFDYRVVTGAGEIEEDSWYGPSSTGGINLLLGINGNYKGFIARAEYSYTRYFYDFTKAEARLEECKASAATCKRAAGGALDLLHAVMVNLGYAY